MISKSKGGRCSQVVQVAVEQTESQASPSAMGGEVDGSLSWQGRLQAERPVSALGFARKPFRTFHTPNRFAESVDRNASRSHRDTLHRDTADWFAVRKPLRALSFVTAVHSTTRPTIRARPHMEEYRLWGTGWRTAKCELVAAYADVPIVMAPYTLGLSSQTPRMLGLRPDGKVSSNACWCCGSATRTLELARDVRL